MLFIVTLFCIVMHSNAQDTSKLQAIVLDSSLTKNANAIVRSEEVEIKINSIRSVTVKTKRIVTVLNKLGRKHADSYEPYDPTTKIKYIKAIVYDASGKEIKKYTRKDFNDRSMYDGFSLIGDNRYIYFDYTPTQYPYTLFFESEVESKSTAFIESWFPVKNYHLSVEEASYRLLNPKKVLIRKKEEFIDEQVISDASNDYELSYRLSGFQAIEKEYKSPPLTKLVPMVKITLGNFSLVNVEGSAEDWKSMGKWQYNNLVSGRSNLSEETVQKVSALVANATTKKEKAKLIYQYVQDKTRYISVQLGIGGWMPMLAEDVDRLGYGDCKALTNYTKALLDSQKIQSYYTVVYAGKNKRNIDSDFASMQGNHVILNVPDEEEDIWLECTSQTLPFNFIGDFTDDRNVLVIKPEGGEIKRTKKYLPEENTLDTKAEIFVKADKSIIAKIQSTSKGLQYDWRYNTKLKPVKDQKIHYKKYWDYITDVQINALELIDNKDIPTYQEKVNLTAANYCKKAGNRLLIAPNAFNRETSTVPKYDDRKTPLVISRGYIDTDEYLINIPAGYEISTLPEKKMLETIFGKYSWELEKVNKSQLKFKRYLKINDGEYPKEKYEEYRQFKSKIKKIDKSKIVVKEKV
ncbi:DUF3857 domain-containing transglutaminase family protein [Aquimarina sp. 2201CG1-2-11]|uniref:DUF3857 domain-containing protein n=1 Tax=Aquimarina discodermiae TaxID=3231043 RepID=UPI0034632821